MTGQLVLCTIFPPTPQRDAPRRGAPPLSTCRRASSRRRDAAAEIDLRLVGERDANLRALPPHHAAMPLAAGLGEVQHEHIRQVCAADLDLCSSVRHIGRNTTERREVRDYDFGRSPGRKAFGLASVENTGP